MNKDRRKALAKLSNEISELFEQFSLGEIASKISDLHDELETLKDEEEEYKERQH